MLGLVPSFVGRDTIRNSIYLLPRLSSLNAPGNSVSLTINTFCFTPLGTGLSQPSTPRLRRGKEQGPSTRIIRKGSEGSTECLSLHVHRLRY